MSSPSMACLDGKQLLESCCDGADSYPQNVAHRLGNPSTLKAQARRLEQDDKLLFNHAKIDVHVTEILSGDHSNCHGKEETSDGSHPQCAVFQRRPRVASLSFENLDALKEHLQIPLQNNLADTASRHVFLRADSNRSPLNCSASILKYICSYHEVSPGFLKLFSRLGDRIKVQRPSHFGGFFEELHAETFNTSSQATSHRSLNSHAQRGPLSMPQLSRSGNQLRCYYQLNGMSYAESGPRKWTKRQATIYHSFDLEFANQFWITIKADEEIERRFAEKQSAESLWEPAQAEKLQGLRSAFLSSLQSHLIHLEWCVEGWTSFIDDKELEIQQKLKRIRAAPVEHKQKGNPIRGRSFYEQSQGDLKPENIKGIHSRPSWLSRRSTIESVAKDVTAPSLKRFLSGLSRRTTFEDDKQSANRSQSLPISYQAEMAHSEAKDSTQRFIDTEEIFKEFSIKGYQRLTAMSTVLQETSLALGSNLQILEGIKDTYNSFFISEECHKEIKDGCQREIHLFTRNLRSKITELRGEDLRLASLISQLQETKPLYESILQYRNLKANEAMALHARHAALRAEAVGERTEQLTSSMHVITTFTLLLLPGTFLGSLFSTDIISRGDSGVKVDSVLGALFLEICLPMMIVSLIAWLLYMLHKQRRSRTRKADLEEGGVRCAAQKRPA